MHISVNMTYVTIFKSGGINVENNDKKALLWPIFTRLLDHALCRPSVYAPSFAPNEISQKVT